MFFARVRCERTRKSTGHTCLVCLKGFFHSVVFGSIVNEQLDILSLKMVNESI